MSSVSSEFYYTCAISLDFYDKIHAVKMNILNEWILKSMLKWLVETYYLESHFSIWNKRGICSSALPLSKFRYSEGACF